MRDMRKIYIPLTVLVCMLVWYLDTKPVSAQEEHCNPTIPIIPEEVDPLGYRLRDGRCEGRYYSGNRHAEVLKVVSFTKDSISYNLQTDKELSVEWTLIKNQSIKLRAEAIRSDFFYSMDTTRPPNTQSYQWDTSILQELNISRDDVGVVGWLYYPKATDQILFIPPIVKQNFSVYNYWRKWDRLSIYNIVLIPGMALREVYITLSPINKNGQIGAPLDSWNGRALNYGYYPSGHGIRFSISGMRSRGIYSLDVGALLQDGSPLAISRWFYHEG